MAEPRYNIEAPNRQRLLNAARAAKWPRIQLSRDIVKGKKDWMGPGHHAYYMFCEQFNDSEIADATAALTDGRIITSVQFTEKESREQDEQISD